MPFSFSTALSGLRASSNALGVTGNNIANANTTAFKSDSINFADVFLKNGGTAVNVGSGVVTTRTSTNFGQGGLNESGSPTSTAIQGNGFFVVADSSGVQSYTRAGDFNLDRDGFLVTTGGQKVQGYPAVNGKIAPGTPSTSIQVPIGATLSPAVTTQTTLRMNLDSSAPINSTFTAPVQVFDSKGLAHTLELSLTKQASGTYGLSSSLDGHPAQTSSATLTFDSNGLLATPSSLSIVPDAAFLDGATLPSININLRQTNPDGTPGEGNITNFGSNSTVTSTEQDGFAAGSLVALATDRNGIISGTFTNGKTRPIAQIAIATFNAQTELRHLGGNLYTETLASGSPSVGTAGTGGRGQVVGGALEQSNVDISNEFTELIVAQRGFQANSRVITTINQTMQDLLQVI